MITLVILSVIAVIMLIWHTLSKQTFKEERLSHICRYTGNRIYLPRTKTNWNMIALTLNAIEYFNERGFKNTKEAKEIEKEIKDLEKQKKRLEYLEELKIRRDKLLEEVNQKQSYEDFVKELEELWTDENIKDVLDYMNIEYDYLESNDINWDKKETEE